MGPSSIPSSAVMVNINAFRTPSSIWATEECHPGMSDQRRQLNVIEEELTKRLWSNRAEFKKPREENEIVAVRREREGRWLRGRVEDELHLQSGPQYKIHLIDYGVTCRVKPSSVKDMPPRFYEGFPSQAMILELQDIVPASLEISNYYDSMNQQICANWTPAAEKFVDSIKKDYARAYFIEGSFPRRGITRFGNLFLFLKDHEDAVSLSSLLCNNGLAQSSHEEFMKRQQALNSGSYEEHEIRCSPFLSDSSNPSSTRCTPSPAGLSVLGKSSTCSERPKLTIEEHIDEMKKRRQEQRVTSEGAQNCGGSGTLSPTITSERAEKPPVIGTPPSSKESEEANVGEDTSPSAPKLNRAALLGKLKSSAMNRHNLSLKKPCESPPENTKKTVSHELQGSSSSSCNSGEQQASSAEAQESIFPHQPTPVVLDSRFVPAGQLLTSKLSASKKSNGVSNSSRDRESNDVFRYSVRREPHIRGRNGQTSMGLPRDHEKSFSSSDYNSDASLDGRAGRHSEMSSDSENVVRTSLNIAQPNLPVKRRTVVIPSPPEAEKHLLESNGATREQSSYLSSSEDSRSSNIEQPTSCAESSSSRPITQPRLQSRQSYIRPGLINLERDSVSSGEEYLTRCVLRHGGFEVNPWIYFEDIKSRSNFSQFIYKYIDSKQWNRTIYTIEKYMWPVVQSRQNVVMISPKESGKTTSYLIPLIDFLLDPEHALKANGPSIVILCATSLSVSEVYHKCAEILSGADRNGPKVRATNGPSLNTSFLVELLNGCDIFITTPPLLLRILKELRYSFAINLRCLHHYILDQADLLMSRFLKEIQEIQGLVLTEQSRRNEPIQTILASRKWHPHFLDFATKLLKDPFLCINDSLEACVYGKPDVFFHVARLQNKPSKLLGVVQDIMRSMVGQQKIVIFCDDEELSNIEEFLKNDCISYLVAPKSISTCGLEVLRSSWESCRSEECCILLTSDSAFSDHLLGIHDATCVIFYSLPKKGEKDVFVQRLSVLLESLPNMLEKTQKQIVSPAIHLMMDETNQEQLPVIVHLMQRISDKIDPKLLTAAEIEISKREREMKDGKLLCSNLQKFGKCWKEKRDCPGRHFYLPDKDSSKELPSSGVMKMQVLKIHDACHFSVRLVEHTSCEGLSKKWPSRYMELGASMFEYFSEEENRKLIAKVETGDLFAIETASDLFQRVQVLEVNRVNGRPFSVYVQKIDEGTQETVKVSFLLDLPEFLKSIPPQQVEVILCGLLPADQDEIFGGNAIKDVDNWLKSVAKNNQRLIQGNIVLSMSGLLWVDPLTVIEYLPITSTYVTVENIGQNLLQLNYAQENKEHLFNLLKLFGKDDDAASLKLAKPASTVFKTQPKPDWAFLKPDEFDDVILAFVENPTHLFFQRKEFQTLLENLARDIRKEEAKLKSIDISSLAPGFFCLGRHETEPGWHRVKVTSVNENNINVFYVDYGDTANLTTDDLKYIPDWAITTLPFQAIECSLAAVASCDSLQKIWDLVDDGSKIISAKVCEKREVADFTGGHHYLLVLVDCAKPCILNRDLLSLEGVSSCDDQLKYLDFDINDALPRRAENSEDGSIEDCESLIDEYPDCNLSDLEFDVDDLDDGMENFDVCGMESLMEDLPQLKEIKALAENPENILFKKPIAVSNANGTTSSAVGSCGQSITSALSNEATNNEATNKVVKLSKKNQYEEESDVSDWSEEEQYFGRDILPMLCSARPPPVKWFEDLYHVWVKFCVTGVKDYFLQCGCNSIQFSTNAGGKLYHLNQPLRGVIYPDSVTSSVKGFTVEVKMRKACSGVFWNRLFSTKRVFIKVSKDLEAGGVDSSSDSDCAISLRDINKEIRRIPLKQRRKKRDLGAKPAGPDVSDDSDDSDREYAKIDFDEF